MDINEFIENFAGQFEDTPADQFKPESRFRDFSEWGSLIALSVIAMVDEEYSITLSGDDVKNSQTIQDIFDVVRTKKGE